MNDFDNYLYEYNFIGTKKKQNKKYADDSD